MAAKPSDKGGLTLASVDIKNFKRIKCVRFDPKAAGLTKIGGMNKAGKTSGLNAIQMGFSGGKYRPSKIHNDSGGPGDYALVALETTNGYRVRIFGKNGTIEVIDPDGVKGGITLFGDAVSSFAIDLRPFIRANAQEKYKILVQTMGIEDLLEKIEAERKVAYDGRAVANGLAAKADTVFKSTPKPDSKAEIPDEVDVVKVSRKIQRAHNKNNARDTLIARQETLNYTIIDVETEIADLEESLEMAKATLAIHRKALRDSPKIPKEIDTSPLQTQLETSQAVNKKRQALLKLQETYDNALQANKDAQQGATDAQTALDAVLTKKHNAVTELGELPNPDITLEDGQMLYKGQEWDCCSGSEEYVIATQMGLANNKGCNFVLVDGLERMDPVEQAKYDAWGEKVKAQIIGTVVTGDPEQCSIFIEDGQIKS
jgi:DNA repair exonuclease SbcCD ATPase subunit